MQVFWIVCSIVLMSICALLIDQHGTPAGRVVVEPSVPEETVAAQSNLTSTAVTQRLDFSVPEFELLSVDGQPIKVENGEGGRTIYHFWASWCAPCIVELPDLLRRAARKPDVRFFLISIDDDIDSIRRFIDRLKRAGGLKDYRVLDNVMWLHDDQKKVAHDLFKSFKVPESFISDTTNSKITTHIIGSADWSALAIPVEKIE